MAELLSKFVRKVRLYIRITSISEIARRYFVKNGMDGLMTTLGIILGAWALRTDNANLIVATGLGACLAMGVSGLFGTYITERAERKGHLKTLEESLLSDLNDSVHSDAHEVVSVFAALIDGLSPSLTAAVALTPFFLTMTGVLIIWDAYLVSFILTFATLFSLGVYLGTIAKENVWLYGLQMLSAGAVIAVIIFLFGGL
ncbi:MAG: VIT1/CCC1 transporter family protein [Candidatus Bathyarchaeia archaeon]